MLTMSPARSAIARARPFDYADLSATERADLRAIATAQRDLHEIFAWGRKQSPPVHPVDVIKQDEFTHDVLVPLTDGKWLVYGTT